MLPERCVLFVVYRNKKWNDFFIASVYCFDPNTQPSEVIRPILRKKIRNGASTEYAGHSRTFIETKQTT